MPDQLTTILKTLATPRFWITFVGITLLLYLLEALGRYLKATVQRPLISLKWRTLTRKGFVLAPEPREARRRRRILNQASKHPAVLVIVGFIFTGLIGNGLVALQEHRQRQRESAVKSMNELRAAYDDLSVGFADYYYRGTALITLKQTDAAPEDLAVAQKAFDTASEKWLERLAADTPTIATLHENATGDYGALTITENIKLATGLVNDCITNTHPKRDPNSKSYTLECTKKEGVTAQTRLATLWNCMKWFGALMRPDPKFDFLVPADNPAAKRVSVVIETACDVKRYFETMSEMSLAYASAVPAAKAPVPKAHTAP